MSNIEHCSICLWQEEKITEEIYMSLRVEKDGKESFAPYEGDIDDCKCCDCIIREEEEEEGGTRGKTN